VCVCTFVGVCVCVCVCVRAEGVVRAFSGDSLLHLSRPRSAAPRTRPQTPASAPARLRPSARMQRAPAPAGTVRGTVGTVRGTVGTVRGTVGTVWGTVGTVRGNVGQSEACPKARREWRCAAHAGLFPRRRTSARKSPSTLTITLRSRPLPPGGAPLDAKRPRRAQRRRTLSAQRTTAPATTAHTRTAATAVGLQSAAEACAQRRAHAAHGQAEARGLNQATLGGLRKARGIHSTSIAQQCVAAAEEQFASASEAASATSIPSGRRPSLAACTHRPYGPAVKAQSGAPRTVSAPIAPDPNGRIRLRAHARIRACSRSHICACTKREKERESARARESDRLSLERLRHVAECDALR
jgi:hypothetical protein